MILSAENCIHFIRNKNFNLLNMSLEQKVMGDLKTAMLAKDEKSLRSLRAIKAAIINLKTSEGFTGEINEDDEIKAVAKISKAT